MIDKIASTVTNIRQNFGPTSDDVTGLTRPLFDNFSLSRAVIDALKLYKSISGTPEIKDKVMLSLGGFDFFAGKRSFDRIAKSSSFRWQEAKLIEADSKSYYTGKDLPTIEIDGALYPMLYGKKASLDKLHELAPEPQIMVDGMGKNHGKWTILSINEDLENFTQDGISTKIGFKISLRKYGE